MFDPLIAARAVHFAATVSVAGAVSFMFFVAEPVFRHAPPGPRQHAFRRQMARLTWIGLGVAVLSGAAWLVLLAAEISGRPSTALASGDVVWTLLTRTRFGNDWSVRFGLAMLLTGVLILPADDRAKCSGWRGVVSLALALALLGSLAWAGHAAGTPGATGYIHVGADALHLVAVGAWVGGLLPLALLLALILEATDPALAAVAHKATRRFSTLGVISVGTILVTGTVNTYVLVGGVPTLIGTDYGRLLLIKIGLFIAMVSIAAINRLRLMPRMSPAVADSGSLRQLLRNSLIELGLGLAIIVIVGALGTLPPGTHALPSHVHEG